MDPCYGAVNTSTLLIALFLDNTSTQQSTLLLSLHYLFMLEHGPWVIEPCRTLGLTQVCTRYSYDFRGVSGNKYVYSVRI